MTYSYFPGCTLKTKAKTSITARISAEATAGFTLEELPGLAVFAAVCINGEE